MKGAGNAKQKQKAGAHDGGGSTQSGVREKDGDTGQGGEGLQPGGQGNGHPQGAAVESVKGASQEVGKPAYLSLTEEGMKDALIEARGDIFIASQLLGVTPIRLHRAISVSNVLQATREAIPLLHTGIPRDDLERAIQDRVSIYRVVGLDALHDLAVMPIDENSAQNQVKLAAAARLAGETAHVGAGGELAETLRELNQLYQEKSPRIRVVRQTLIEIGGSADETVAEISPLPASE